MKLSYEQLVVAVEKVYHQLSQDNQADTAAMIVSALIQGANWTEDQYWEEWLNRSEGLDKSSSEPYITGEEIN